MKFLMHCAFLGAAVCVASVAYASAATPPSQAAINRRQLSDCMNRHMAASRTLSYNDAAKMCKDLLRAPSDALTASNEAKPAKAR